MTDDTHTRLLQRAVTASDGSGSYEGSIAATVADLVRLQATVGAPVELSAIDSDAACGTWGTVELTWSAPVPVDPLHARARNALATLGLDGSRLEMAVSIFGWASDAANGVLLGLVREAWDDPTAYTDPEAFADMGHSPDSAVSIWGVWGRNDESYGDGETEHLALVDALETKVKTL